MNFHDLRIIVSQIKRTLKCPECNGKYTDEDIEVIGHLDHEQSFFHAYCPECELQALIHVNLQIEPLSSTQCENCAPRFRLGTAPRMGHVSVDEVLDMSNFLKSFNGDFTRMFKKEK